MTPDSTPCILHPAYEPENYKPGLSLEELEDTLHPQVRRQSSSYSIFPPTPFLLRSVYNFFSRMEKNIRGPETLMQSKRARERNMKHSSIRNIPNELLLLIFRLFCWSSFESGDACPQIILGTVSSDWRRLVMSVPELWETFSVRVTDEKLPVMGPLWWMCCHRRGSFPSLIQIDLERLDYSGSGPNDNVLESLLPLENAIFASERSTEITTMELHCPPLHWVATSAANCSGLHDLSLSYTSQNTGTFSWPSFFRLAPLPGLHVLRLDHVPITLCLELLQACTDLIEFHCNPLIRSKVKSGVDKQWKDGENWMIDRRRVEMIFPKLKHLTWIPKAKSFDSYFLRFYRFPNLRSISWPIWLGQHSREQFNTFVSALPEDFEMFEMIYVPSLLMPWGRYRKILEMIPRATKYLVFRGFPSSSHARLLEISQVPALGLSLTAVKFIQ